MSICFLTYLVNQLPAYLKSSVAFQYKQLPIELTGEVTLLSESWRSSAARADEFMGVMGKELSHIAPTAGGTTV